MNTEQANLIACPDCGKKISRQASTCPHCGRSLTKIRSLKIGLFSLGIFVLTVILVFFVSDNRSVELNIPLCIDLLVMLAALVSMCICFTKPSR